MVQWKEGRKEGYYGREEGRNCIHAGEGMKEGREKDLANGCVALWVGLATVGPRMTREDEPVALKSSSLSYCSVSAIISE
jgi:hypothetical protein